MRPPYPLFASLEGQPVLIVGGGEVAHRKLQGLLECGAQPTLVAPHFGPAVLALGDAVERHTESYTPAVLAQRRWRLVFAATDRPAVNAQVLADAEAAGLWCCRCDEGDTGHFTGGAVRHLPGVTLAVSTHGASPKLAARLRDAALATLDPMLQEWSQLLAALRPEVKRAVPDPAMRAALLKRLGGAEMESVLRQHGRAAAEAEAQRWIAAAAREHSEPANPERSPTDAS